ncbi:class I SAM-dependent methyltransferase [Lentibacillus saliphilus]|uniref:class I SAM-dependent methyltransferase n=1 Tax=Lentibacillus saliphilus TaxID=2737028 RepID=UPI001C30C419
MEKSKVEQLFQWLDDTTNTLHIEAPYLDKLAICMDTLLHGSPDDVLSDEVKEQLRASVATINSDAFNAEHMRKAIQLAVLKGMRDSTQQQHLITPETIALIIGYLAEKLSQGKEQLTLFDPVCGTANLITVVLDQLKADTIAYAGEVDPTLINVAVLNANLQKREIEFFHQDSLQPMLLDPVDMVVADLPVGYYPDDVRAKNYELNSQEGHAYAHHLFIEQSLNYTKPAGYLIFIVPEFLFESDQAEQLQTFIREHAHIVGMLGLPESAFRNKHNRKSILILQKKGEGTEAPKQPLLVQLPSFKESKAMASIMAQMNAWFQAYNE